MDFFPLTQLQFVLLSLLLEKEERSSRELQSELKEKYDHNPTLAAFYQLMGWLEQAGLVSGEDRPHRVGDQTVYAKYYKITEQGEKAYAEMGHKVFELLGKSKRFILAAEGLSNV